MTLPMNDATRAQVDAARPHKSTWVEANAGSGKTRVLTDRVARLLLHGTEPQKILCLTYTKAAASEMQNRLFKRLGEWAMMPDEDLTKALAELGEAPEEGSATLRSARRLFAKALETPGGLKIQTLHSFCETLLRRFPVEAGVAPDFDVLSENALPELRRAALEDLALSGPQNMLSQLLAVPDAGGLDRLIPAIEAARDIFDNAQEAALDAVLGLSADTTLEGLLDSVAAGIGTPFWDDMIATLLESGGNDGKMGEKLAKIPDGPTNAQLRVLEDAFLTGKGTLRKNFPKKGLQTAEPDLCQRMQDLGLRVEAARDTRLALAARDRSLVLLRFARAYLARFTARKQALGVLDFDDQIMRARALLTRSEMAQWALYKLDGGIDHILVDEAQDTSPMQWDVVSALAEEFLAGDGARDRPRTIFVVGDPKQSIYSFQGADPREFERKRSHFAAYMKERAARLEESELLYSFRSARSILELADTVMEEEGRAGVQTATRHRAFHDEKPGRVEHWPVVESEAEPDERPWFEPVDTPSPRAAEQLLADQIAARIAGMLSTPTRLPGTDRNIKAGDILILVQKRNDIYRVLHKTLRAHNLPVAGADRLELTSTLVVRDLIALMRFCVTPEDDLSLATVLRSPLCGLSQDALFGLAHDRGASTLFPRLQAARDAFGPVVEMLEDLRRQSDFLRPFEFLQRVLIHYDGRQKWRARMRDDVLEPMDELCSQAISFEQENIPNLTGFLEWLTSGDFQVKREMDKERDEIRLMTAHGAKGLEAPIVFLPDTGVMRASNHTPLRALDVEGCPPVWAKAQDLPQVAKDAKSVQDDLLERERERLLYVALTRAETWLIICGAQNKAPSDNALSKTWHEMTRIAMEKAGARPVEDPALGTVLTLENNWVTEALDLPPTPATATPALPDWAHTAPPPETVDQGVVSPSDLGGAHALSGEGDDTETAMARGTFAHSLIEALNTCAAEDRPARARDMAENHPHGGIAQEVLNLFAHEGLRDILTPEALVFDEHIVTGDIAGLGRISGRIDRLIVHPDSVVIVDYKTNRMVPVRPEDTPEAILRQMAAYRDILQNAFPDKDVLCGILWTAYASFMELNSKILEAALRRATAS